MSSDNCVEVNENDKKCVVNPENACKVETVDSEINVDSKNMEASTQTANENGERITELQEEIKLHEDHIKSLTEKCALMETQLETAIKQKEAATREKDAMVIKYAVSEKNVLEQQQQKDQFKKKHAEALRDIEILEHKVKTQASEKIRICQLLDNKCFELKTTQQDRERIKGDLNVLETKVKWMQNNLKAETELHHEMRQKFDNLNQKHKELLEQVEQPKPQEQSEQSENNNSHQQLKEQEASLILLKHEKNDKEQQIKSLCLQLDKLQSKNKEMLEENNELSLKVQHLERDRLVSEQKLSDFRATADQQRQTSADLQAKNAEIDQLKLQLKNVQNHLNACNEQIDLLKRRNTELENDMIACRDREAELLFFTQQLTDKNVRLQSEFTALETKVHQLTCEQTILKRQVKEHETAVKMLSSQLSDERHKFSDEVNGLKQSLAEKTHLVSKLSQEVEDEKEQNSVLQRKFQLTLREANKELQQYRKKCEYPRIVDEGSNSSSSSSLSVASPEQTKDNSCKIDLNKQTLIEHIVKLQRASAKKSEKIDFLEEHVNTLILELQKKSRLLQMMTRD